MAMLAEPRRRKGYVLTPKGKALYEDEDRFGTKMLKKMGWSNDKGLGANENGSQDFVRLRYKNDSSGFGYGQRDDQWTQHDEGFDGLLQSLNVSEESGDSITVQDKYKESDQDDVLKSRVGFGFQESEAPKKSKHKLKEKISGESLEEKSKNSKARVHYKKFTKGKDLSQYSEKDLANIFGKKLVDENVNNIYEQFTAITIPQNNKSDNEQEEEEVKGSNFGEQMISTGLTVSDYFKQKMEAMKQRKLQQTVSEVNQKESIFIRNETTKNCVEDEPEKRKKQKRALVEEESTELPEALKDAPKKKIKKNRTQQLAIAEASSKCVEENLEEKPMKSKKSKDVNLTSNVITLEDSDPAKIKINKKKKKNKSIEDTNVKQVIEADEVLETVLKKKKNSKDSKTAEKTLPQIIIAKQIFKEPLQGVDLTDLCRKSKKKSKETVFTEASNSSTSKRSTEYQHIDNTVTKRKSGPEIKDVSEDIFISHKDFLDPTIEETSPTYVEQSLAEKPSKSKKSKDVNLTSDVIINNDFDSAEIKKRKKNKPIVKQAIESDEVLQTAPKKKKKNKDNQTVKKTCPELNVEGINFKEPQDVNLIELSKKSKKKSKETLFTEAQNSFTSSQYDNTATKWKSNPDVSATSDRDNLELLISTRNSYNQYLISSFCAEKFRNADLERFAGASLTQIVGYGLSNELELDIKTIEGDEQRISQLWSCVINKYDNEAPKDTYFKYKNKLHAARRAKERVPRLCTKSLKRKNAFSGI